MWGCIIIWKYVVKRLLQLILILFGITLLSFALMQTASGDTVDAIQQQMGTSMSEEAKAALRHEMGLDQPFIIQYFQWVGKIFTGNMGYSYIKNQEVFPMFMQALPNTLLLTLSSIVTTILISIPLGIWSAVKQNKITGGNLYVWIRGHCKWISYSGSEFCCINIKKIYNEIR